MHRANNRLPVQAIILSIIAGVVFFFLLGVRVAAQPEPGKVEHYVVQPGDTLWRLASQRTEPGEDVRSGVGDIKRLNGLETSELRAGQLLLLPSE